MLKKLVLFLPLIASFLYGINDDELHQKLFQTVYHRNLSRNERTTPEELEQLLREIAERHSASPHDISSPSVLINTPRGGRTLLNEAIMRGTNTDGGDRFVEILLNYGADADLPDSSGDSPLRAAYNCSRLNIMALLLSHGAQVIDTGRPRILREHLIEPIIQNDLAEPFSLMLPYISNINDPLDPRYHLEAPLIQAVLYRAVNIMRLVLEAGANPNVEASTGVTPLHFAVMENFDDGAELLLQFGARSNLTHPTQLPPLWTAALAAANPTMTFFLLRSGSNPNLSIPATGTSSELFLIGRIFHEFLNDQERLREPLHLLLLFGAAIDTEVPNYQEILQRLYIRFPLLQAVVLDDIAQLRNLLEMQQYPLMNEQQRISHIRKIRRTWGNQLNAALALAIGQRRFEAVQDLIVFANPTDTIPTTVHSNVFPHVAPIDMTSFQLIAQLLASSHFTPEQHEQYRRIAYILARRAALQLRVLLPYNQRFHFLPSDVVLGHIVPQGEFYRIVEEVYHGLAPNFGGIPNPVQALHRFSDEELTRLLFRPTWYQYYRHGLREASEQERLNALQRAIEGTHIEWVRRLAPLIHNAARMADMVMIAQGRLQQLENTFHADRAREIVGILQNRYVQIPILGGMRPLMIDFPPIWKQ